MFNTFLDECLIHMIDEGVPKEVLSFSDENQMKMIAEPIPKGTTEDISKVITKKKAFKRIV